MSHVLLDLQHILVIPLLFHPTLERKLQMCFFHTGFPVEILFLSRCIHIRKTHSLIDFGSDSSCFCSNTDVTKINPSAAFILGI